MPRPESRIRPHSARTESSQAAGHQITRDGEVTPPIYGVPLNGSGTGGNTTPVYGSGGYGPGALFGLVLVFDAGTVAGL